MAAPDAPQLDKPQCGGREGARLGETARFAQSGYWNSITIGFYRLTARSPARIRPPMPTLAAKTTQPAANNIARRPPGTSPASRAMASPQSRRWVEAKADKA